nr:helix-turn-helix transcriptional regulator [Chloroflexia bacterium]
MVKADGGRLRAARERQLLTLRALAAKSGVQFHTIHAIETGKQEPRPSTLRKLCDALGIEPTEVLAAEIAAAER